MSCFGAPASGAAAVDALGAADAEADAAGALDALAEALGDVPVVFDLSSQESHPASIPTNSALAERRPNRMAAMMQQKGPRMGFLWC